MASIFYSEFYGDRGTVWRVELWDTSFSSTGATEILLMNDGFTLEYQGQGNEIFDPIKSSELKVHLCISDDTAGATLLTWLQSAVLATYEDRFSIALYKNGSIYWYGVVLPDLSGMVDDSAPFEFTLTATDGLARLKDFTFDYATDTNNLAKFTQVIYAILKQTPAYITGTQTDLFATSVDWYEEQMGVKSASADPLFLSYVHSLTFANKSDDGNWEGMTYYEALEHICKHWAMQVKMVNGIFHFIQLGVYEGVDTQYLRYYKRSDGTYRTASTFTPKVNINVSTGSLPRVKAGGQWNYYPPLKDVYLRFPFSNVNFLNGLQDIPYVETINQPIIGGTNVSLQFTTTLAFLAYTSTFTTIPATGVNISCLVKIKLDTTFWVKKVAFGAAITWEGTTEVYEEVVFRNDNSPINISFLTPDIPSGNYSSMEVTIEDIVVVDRITGVTYTDGVDYSVWRMPDSTSLKYVSSGTDSDYFEYVARNTATPINSYDIEEPDAIFGDGYFEGSYGSLYVFDTSSVVVSSGRWFVNGIDGPFAFNILRIRDIAAAQTLPTPKYQGSIVGGSSISAINSFVYDGFIYIFNGATLTGVPEEWDGEWTKVDYNSVILDIDEPEVYGGDTTRNLLKPRSGYVNQDRINKDIYESIYKLTTQTNENLSQSVGFVQNQVNELVRQDYVLFETISTDTTGVSDNIIYICTASLDLTLPPASEWVRNTERTIEITVMNQDGGGSSVTVKAYTGETINGASEISLARYHSVTLISDGTNIYIKSSFKHT